MQPNPGMMSNNGGGAGIPQPPSMEELLASIRRIISEESSGKANPPPAHEAQNAYQPPHHYAHEGEFSRPETGYEDRPQNGPGNGYELPDLLPDSPPLPSDPRHDLARSPRNANDPWAIEESESLVLSSAMMQQARPDQGLDVDDYSNGQFHAQGRREPRLDQFPAKMASPPQPAPAMAEMPPQPELSAYAPSPNPRADNFRTDNFRTDKMPNSDKINGHFAPSRPDGQNFSNRMTPAADEKIGDLSAVDLGFSSTIADNDFFDTHPDELARAAKHNKMQLDPLAPAGQENPPEDDAVLLSTISEPLADSPRPINPTSPGVTKFSPSRDGGAAGKMTVPPLRRAEAGFAKKSEFSIDFGPKAAAPATSVTRDPFAASGLEPSLSQSLEAEINQIARDEGSGLPSGALGHPDLTILPAARHQDATELTSDELHLTRQDVPPLTTKLGQNDATPHLMMRENAPDPLMQAEHIGMDSVPASALGYDPGASLLSREAQDATARAFAKLSNVTGEEFERTARNEYINDHARRGITVEEMVMDALKPAMQEWLDLNLPRIVEILVKDEIKRVSPRKK
ncbi:MAG: DUF2497 domain-containing protein [Candidatus Symbiobacter sp.]|nr:DUF2497 domain-containing protein [Candidatus Symbiobacter sp.]